MKKLLLMTATVSLLAVAGCQCPFGLFPKKESAETIVAKMQKAIDVSGKQNQISSAVIVYDSHLGKKKNGRVTLKLKKKGKIRLEVRRKNSIMIRACNEKGGWEYTTAKGLRLLQDKELSELRFQAAYLAPNAKYNKLFTDIKLDGSAKAAGLECWKLVCTPQIKYNTAPVILFVDKKNYMVIKTIETINLLKIVTYFGDYEEHNGIMTPFMMVSQVGNRIMESKLISAEWNVNIADSEFETPRTLSKSK